MAKVRLLFFLLGVIGPGGGTLLYDGLPNSTTVQENTPAGTSVYSFSVNSTAGLAVTPYIINSSPLTKAFQINSNPPVYYVVTTGSPALDFETMPNSFELQIYAEDNLGTTELQTLTVQLINVNEPPELQGNIANQVVSVYIQEASPPGTIYQVLASDPEDPSNTLKFSLTPASSPFTLSSTSLGFIQSTKTFDYETDPHSYSLTVTVTDSGGLSVNGSLIVYITNINDETPYFITTNTSFSIPEEQSTGTILTTITAMDPDAAGFLSTLYYSIDPPNQYFSINELTGTIQIAQTIDVDNKPLRLTPVITFQVKVTDLPSGGHSNYTTISVTIQDINDNPPVCNMYAYSVAVPETQVNGSVIIDLSNQCKDIDVDTQYNIFNFTGLSGLGSNERFQLIPSGSGRIVLTGDLDFESPNNIGVGNEYSLTLSVQDIAYPYYNQNIYVYVKTTPVNEYPPVFNSSYYVFNISELSPPSSKVGQVFATDADYPYIGITYTLVAGGSTLSASNIFWVNPTTGDLELADYTDYETTRQYQLIIQATDSALQSTTPSLIIKTATTSVTVNILEANDEKPICKPNSYTMSVPVDQATGSNIQNFMLTCTDRDSGPTSFQYSINSGNINNHFVFSPSAGSNISRLLLANPFDYTNGADKTWNYNLLVYITDGNVMSTSPQRLGVVQTGTVTLNVNVYIPGLTTTITTTTPRVVYITNSKNVYSGTAWYVPFVITLGCLLLLGFLGLMGYLIAKYCPCRTSPKPDTEALIKPVEKKKVKQDVVWEMTKMNTVFDGEAVDPITGNVYEYNSKSGARRWKDTKQPISAAQSPQQAAAVPTNPSAPPPASIGTPNKKEKPPNTPTKQEEGKNATKPATPKRLRTPNQTSPLESGN
ncbi:cadherin-related family member 3 [Mantella aurantiaca]